MDWQRLQGQQHVRLHVPFRRGAAALAVVTVTAIGCSSAVTQPAAPVPATASAAAQPETEAGVRAAATAFYAFYSAGLWPQAWAMLTPASQAQAPEAVYAAVHQGCPSPSAGMARVIKSVVMAGSAAVVTETIAGAASALGSQADAWSYAGGRWGIALDQTAVSAYSHGTAAADVAALKAAGQCAGSQPSLAPLPTIAAS
jgi:hypothetical protein